ncbi:hypothetical protein MCEREM21A_00948 [Sphingomonadaceae bacterium]
MLQEYRQHLRDLVAKQERQREAEAILKLKERRDWLGNLKPLTEQITELMLSLPPSQRDRPWSIVDLQGRLQGRYKDRPSLGNIGDALRTLGWTQRRDWTKYGGGCRLWKRP